MKMKFEYSGQEYIRVTSLDQLSFAEFNDEEERQTLQAVIEFKKNLRVRFGKYGELKLEYFWVVKSKKVKSFIRG